jgi:DNA-binding SARP family transcriptional activator
MHFRILGPLEFFDGKRWKGLGAAKPRALLATLLINSNEVVAVDQLSEELWGERQPRVATNLIQQYVMRLRRTLRDRPGRLLVTRPRGYQLLVDAEDLDAQWFGHLLASGRSALRAGQPQRAATLLADALGLWRGRALVDVPPTTATEAEAARLEEQRLAAVEARIDAELACGRQVALIPELRKLVLDQPLRERLWGQLMLALYRSGRQADALAAYGQVAQLLHAELGVSPGAEIRQLQQQIRRADPSLGAPLAGVPLARPARHAVVGGGPRPLLRQLPADVARFTGRGAHLRQLDRLLGDHGAAPTAPVITVIAGTAGVGKTALAVHWAHRLAARFADGQLYLDLRGHACGPPTRPVDALAQLLRAAGVAAAQVPAELAEAASMYRSLLADRRVLVVLDNAASPDQVRPLLPGSPTCLVVITSRNQLGGLIAKDGAQPLTLDVLGPDEAVALVGKIIGGHRTHAEPAAAAKLARLCAHLPLALCIAGANLASRPHQRIADFVAELAQGGRLAKLVVNGDEQTTIKGALDLSYQRLAAQERQLFRLLGLAPGDDVSAAAAATLAGITPEQAEPLLDRLAAAHLLEQRAPGRFAFHDLLRLYAADRLLADARAAGSPRS